MWPSINSLHAKGGESIDQKATYASLNEYISDEHALKRKVGEKNINGKVGYETLNTGFSQTYSLMFETQAGVFEFNFPNIAEASKVDTTAMQIMQSIRFK